MPASQGDVDRGLDGGLDGWRFGGRPDKLSIFPRRTRTIHTVCPDNNAVHNLLAVSFTTSARQLHGVCSRALLLNTTSSQPMAASAQRAVCSREPGRASTNCHSFINLYRTSIVLCHILLYTAHLSSAQTPDGPIGYHCCAPLYATLTDSLQKVTTLNQIWWAGLYPLGQVERHLKH